jgi:hypothetical protein
MVCDRAFGTPSSHCSCSVDGASRASGDGRTRQRSGRRPAPSAPIPAGPPAAARQVTSSKFQSCKEAWTKEHATWRGSAAFGQGFRLRPLGFAGHAGEPRRPRPVGLRSEVVGRDLPIPPRRKKRRGSATPPYSGSVTARLILSLPKFEYSRGVPSFSSVLAKGIPAQEPPSPIPGAFHCRCRGRRSNPRFDTPQCTSAAPRAAVRFPLTGIPTGGTSKSGFRLPQFFPLRAPAPPPPGIQSQIMTQSALSSRAPPRAPRPDQPNPYPLSHPHPGPIP